MVNTSLAIEDNSDLIFFFCKGAVLVYDITDVNSFLRVKNWVKELKKVRGSNVCLSIAGNKMDLEKSRTVSQEEAERYAKG